jgi:dynein heavy chain
LVKLEKETKEVEAVKEIVEIEEMEVQKEKDIVESIKNDCQSRLDEAMPMLDEAIKALKTLNTRDFVEMKSFNNPPLLIKLALDSVCVMLGVQPKIEEKTVGKTKVKTAIYWDNIPDERMERIVEYLENPKFVPENIRNASEAAEGICKWVIAICKYDVVAKEVRPKRAALVEASEKLERVV